MILILRARLLSASARRLFSRSAALFSARVSPVGDLTLSLGGLRVPALVRFSGFTLSFGGLRVPALVRLISEFYLSVSVAVSGGESERKKPSSGCADLAGKTQFQQQEGRRSVLE